jgi:dimeric dUTPase (all-alpha-NTP-PPase superfamily)
VGILMYGKKLHGKNYTNGLNIKVCLVVDSFSRNLKKQFLIIKIDMSKILIIEDEAAIRRVLSKYFLRRVIPTS